MDMGTFRGLLTIVLMVLFVGLVFWAYSRRRRDEFEAAARLPLEDDAAAADDAPDARRESD